MQVQDCEDDAIKLGGFNAPLKGLNKKVSTTCEKYRKRQTKKELALRVNMRPH